MHLIATVLLDPFLEGSQLDLHWLFEWLMAIFEVLVSQFDRFAALSDGLFDGFESINAEYQLCDALD